jgi:DNA-binding transcriptional ArsR family regulator
MTEHGLDSLALAVKTLGHPARLRIVAMLRHNRLSVCQIASVLDVPASTASGYLLELRRAGLVTEQRSGNRVYYRLAADDGFEAIMRVALLVVADDPLIRHDTQTAGALDGTSPDPLCCQLGVAPVVVSPVERRS